MMATYRSVVPEFNADADFVARPDPDGGELGGQPIGGLLQLGVGQDTRAGVDGRLVGSPCDRRAEDVDERARWGA